MYDARITKSPKEEDDQGGKVRNWAARVWLGQRRGGVRLRESVQKKELEKRRRIIK